MRQIEFGMPSMSPADKTLVPRILVGAPQGRSGKTTLTLGLLRAISREGVRVQPFKKGPDFIDPGWHSIAAGQQSRNLDPFFLSREQILHMLTHDSRQNRLSIIEGAMGLFDGLDVQGSCSTAELARFTGTPVLLVIDATRMTRSAAAIVMGCQHFEPGIQIRGVILNKVSNQRQEHLMQAAIEEYCGIPVIGAVPKNQSLTIPDRHLGLVTNGETEQPWHVLDDLADTVIRHVNLEAIYAIADSAPAIDGTRIQPDPKASLSNRVRIGVIRDKVFSFYYPENLEALQFLGAELVIIDSLNHRHLPPDIAGLYIGGGFPEVFATRLAENASLRSEIRYSAENGLPIYAECGGLMYLGRSLQLNGQSYPMVGVFPFDSVMESKPQGHGYTLIRSLGENGWFSSGLLLKGHEFHHSRLVNLARDAQFAFEVERGHGIDGQHDGLCYKNVLASYTHVHAFACPQWAISFVAKAKDNHRNRRIRTRVVSA